MPTPSQSDEVAFISGVATDRTLPIYAYSAWNDDNPATYTGGYTSSTKWGQVTADTPGGTISYYFDPTSAWNTTEQQTLAAGLSLWSAITNISFVQTSNSAQAQIVFQRNANKEAVTTSSSRDVSPNHTSGKTGGNYLLQFTRATVSIDTTASGFGPIDGSFNTAGGYPWMTLLHEEGHALGLGHAGPYNDTVNASQQQYSAYDTRLWSIMSYIEPTTMSAAFYSGYSVTGTRWGSSGGYHRDPTTWMPLDILAIQSLYGTPLNTPLSGGQIFGFNSNITGAIAPFFDFTTNTTPVITIWDKGTGNTLDLSGFTSSETINLNSGTFSSVDGLADNIAIAYNTAVDTLVCGSGASVVICNDDGDTVSGGGGADTITGGAGSDTLKGGSGNDLLNGGANVDTAVVSGSRSVYVVNQTATDVFTISGPDGTDTLSNIEYLKFDDKTLRLLPGTGVSVDFNANPTTYMGPIRDFDGYDLGGASSWQLIGTADTNGNGTVEHILVNKTLGRWAEVSAASDGKVYFGDYSWAGETRVVGLYVDPLVAQGAVVKGSAQDSQRRFANDLTIGNIGSILGAADYNHDGLQEIYFALTDHTAYLHAYMHADGNIQYANYQSQQQVVDYLAASGWASSTWSGWFPSSQTAAAAPPMNFAPQSAASTVLGLATGS